MKTTIAALVMALLVSSAAAQTPFAMPVMITGGKDRDPCRAGKVELAAFDGGFLAVRAGPGQDFPHTAKLDHGYSVFICAQQGEWTGVVYSETGTWAEPCGVSKPWRRTLPYTGPCASGWVPRRSILRFE
jgi:hypothetical protein